MSEVHEYWQAQPTWEIAVVLHSALCQQGHQMDQCWGLYLPYDLAQPHLSRIQREYLTMAYNLEAEFGAETALRLAKLLARDVELVPLPPPR